MTERSLSKGSVAIDSSLAIERLRSRVQGSVIAPGEPGFDERRRVFYGGYDRLPAVVVAATGAADVQAAVDVARESGLELAIRSGGHSVGGHSTTDGGILLDLSGMRAIDVDVSGRTAWAEPGITAGEFTRRVQEHDLVVGFGDTSSVGLGGLALGGGVGYLSRKFGLTIDSVLAAELVTADGQLRQVDDQQNPELFWAIRGGGGNFGVVTRLKFRLHDLGPVFGGIIVLPATPEALTAIVAAASAASEDLSLIANVLCPTPPMPFIPAQHHGGKVILTSVVFAGPVAQAEAAVAPFRALGPIADLLHPMRYAEIFPPDDPSYHPVAVSRNMFMDRFNAEDAAAIFAAMDRSDAPMRACQIRVLGGAVARVPNGATAYAFRDRPIMVNVATLCGPEGVTPERTKWVETLSDRLRGADRSAYVNFIGAEGPDRVRDAYPPATWDRLAAIKARYDPTNLFHRNQNVSGTRTASSKAR